MRVLVVVAHVPPWSASRCRGVGAHGCHQGRGSDWPTVVHSGSRREGSGAGGRAMQSDSDSEGTSSPRLSRAAPVPQGAAPPWPPTRLPRHLWQRLRRLRTPARIQRGASIVSLNCRRLLCKLQEQHRSRRRRRGPPGQPGHRRFSRSSAIVAPLEERLVPVHLARSMGACSAPQANRQKLRNIVGSADARGARCETQARANGRNSFGLEDRHISSATAERCEQGLIRADQVRKEEAPGGGMTLGSPLVDRRSWPRLAETPHRTTCCHGSCVSVRCDAGEAGREDVQGLGVFSASPTPACSWRFLGAPGELLGVFGLHERAPAPLVLCLFRRV